MSEEVECTDAENDGHRAKYVGHLVLPINHIVYWFIQEGAGEIKSKIGDCYTENPLPMAFIKVHCADEEVSDEAQQDK